MKYPLTFIDLPQELQDKIWSLTMPSYYAESQAHFFSLQHNTNNDKDVRVRWDYDYRDADGKWYSDDIEYQSIALHANSITARTIFVTMGFSG